MKKIGAIILLSFIGTAGIAQSFDEQAANAKKIANTGKVEEAKNMCEAILLKNPNHGETNVVYAMINEYQKNYEVAELHFITAEKSIKKDPVLYFRLANLTQFLQSKDPTDPDYKYKTATAYLDKAKVIAPKLYTVYLMYADIVKTYCPGQQVTNGDSIKKRLYIKNMEKYIELGGNDCQSLSYFLGNFKSDIKLDLYIKGCAYLFNCSNPQSNVNYTDYVENSSLNFIWQSGDYENCVKLAKFVASQKCNFPHRVRATIISCYEKIAIKNNKNVFDNIDYLTNLKLGKEKADYDKLRYYDKLIAIYKHKKNETEWKKLEREKNDTECYDLLGEANKLREEEEKYIQQNMDDKGRFSKEEIEEIIKKKKYRLYHYRKILEKTLNPALKSLAEKAKTNLDEEIAQVTSELK